MGKNVRNIPAILVSLGLGLIVNETLAGEETSYSTILGKSTVVIADLGGKSIAGYMPAYKKSNESVEESIDKKPKTLFSSYFPVVTESMSVGKLTEHEANNIRYRMVTQPLFIIGYDPVSINWLKKNKKLLKLKRAIGLVVNVGTKKQMAELNEIGDGVILQPTLGDSLSTNLNIKHYPFYMDNQGVMR